MGLMQRALETYESHLRFAGNREGSTAMAPIAHIVTRADVEITLDSEGVFVIASAVAKTEPKIIIPATEASAGRTSAPCAHPLCEQLGYLLPQNEKKYKLYIGQLTAWEKSKFSHPKLRPVLRYVENGTVLEDLVTCGLVKLTPNGMPENEKLFIRWRVQEGQIEECWQDSTLLDAYTRYSIQNSKGLRGLCMVTGEEAILAGQHPKGIVPFNGNAKLISANDSSGFTYRGRFTEEWQAGAISYEASQKAHNALRWLVQEQGVKETYGGRTFLCWNPQGKVVTPVTMPFRTSKPVFRASDYREALKKTLESKKQEFEITDGVIIVAFDAATTGRLSVTYYNEFLARDFFQRLHDWDKTCCWCDYRFGIQSPTLRQIVNCAFGTQKTEKGVTRMSADEQVMCQQMQRLVACRVDRAGMGTDIVRALVSKASQLQIYEPSVRETILSTACAVIRKYRNDRFKEEWEMALETEKRDRSYQFGRLLAVMEKVERDTYDDADEREPNAIRMQSVFCQRPMYAAGILEKQLEQAYFLRHSPGIRGWYKTLIAQIMEIISQFPQEEWNMPLEDSYLMGYYLQRNAMYTKNNKDMEVNENESAE